MELALRPRATWSLGNRGPPSSSFAQFSSSPVTPKSPKKSAKCETTQLSSADVLVMLDYRNDWSENQLKAVESRVRWPARQPGRKWYRPRAHQNDDLSWNAIRGKLSSCSDNRDMVFDLKMDLSSIIHDASSSVREEESSPRYSESAQSWSPVRLSRLAA
ncbi:MAG: hypothetical protein KVP17_004659 [Porospora cf. gigantea B]|uniref:uncharacterized protein n=1 Tax=Porospora cf. gigantea B TaxID=2853592 RepID=UPI003571F235|nr:MAG: hypothetical protein KVP17_004659 [Porospora cf. gigantea B]